METPENKKAENKEDSNKGQPALNSASSNTPPPMSELAGDSMSILFSSTSPPSNPVSESTSTQTPEYIATTPAVRFDVGSYS